MIKVGDIVWWKEGYGPFARTTKARISAIDLCAHQGQKYGTPVESVTDDQLANACFTLHNGHWAFGTQVTPIVIAEEKAA